MQKQLKEKIYEAVEAIKAKYVAIAFSGGVDSSLLAKVCKDLDKAVTLLTISFYNDRDIKIANETAKSLKLPLLSETVALDELERGLQTVLKIIEFDRIARLENCLCFYYVFRLASKHGIRTVVSANGTDELFCGYNKYKNLFGRKALDYMKTSVKLAIEDKKEMNKLAKIFGIKYACPFLAESFIDFALSIPLELKIKSADDELRKHILRSVALELGVPPAAALRPKKAFQYSSGAHKAIVKLARVNGFTRKAAKAAGFSSEMEAYIKSLKMNRRDK